MGVIATGTPLVTIIFPGVMIPVPLVNVAVRLAEVSDAMMLLFGVKLSMAGGGTTVIAMVCVATIPILLVTASVYTVLTLGDKKTGVPLAMGMLPGVITPTPLMKSAVTVAALPAVIAGELA